MADINWSSPHTGSSEAARQIEVLWLTDSIFVVIWVNSTSTAFECDVYSYDGSHLHSQTLFSVSPLTIYSASTQLAKVRDNMFVLAYQDNGGFDAVRMRSLTWNGSSITDNGEVAALANQQTSKAAVCNEGDDKIMLWGRRFDLADILYCKYCTYNGASWSIGAANSISGAYYADTLRACKAADDKGILFWDKDPGDDGKCHAFTTSAGGGTNIVSVDGAREIRYLNACNMGDNKIIFVCFEPDSPSGAYTYAITTDNELYPDKPTVGTGLFLDAGNCLNTCCAKIDETHFVVVFRNNSQKGSCIYCTVDWDTLIITPGDIETFSENSVGGGSVYGLGMDSNSEGKIALAYRDITDSNYLKTIVGSIVTTPSPPTGISAVSGEGENIISFTTDPEATSTHIYWGNSPGVSTETGTKIPGVSSPYTHDSLNPSLTYYYILTSENAEGEGVPSAEYNDSPYPEAPENLVVTPGIQKNIITFDSSLGADSYNLYWSLSPSVNKITGNKIVGITSGYEHTSLTPGQPVYYAVAAEDEDDESSLSSEDSGIPLLPAPANLSATASGERTIEVTWDFVSGATKYNIYWGLSSGVTKLNGTKISDVTSPYSHEDLTPDQDYYYIVTAENYNDESADSTEDYDTAVITDVIISSVVGADSQNTITWNMSEAVDSYNIYYMTSPGVTQESGTLISGATSPYIHIELDIQDYYYIVVPVVDSIEYTASAEVSGKPKFSGKIFNHSEAAQAKLIYQYQKE